ncbi:MerR family transcriptional regulator [Paenibacillus dendritiformis]|uniref:helix-turn-helix domain-containing protein n=1 Tax=Paenibacillus dendritiformis TaxID=130049 RepID=UPI00248AA6D4|nr:MerR family transcriptional regulator [Paenibacillus dendritiformis]WGU97636.1 MerR family transcriptional regulator [Paenibacillus dendritiformis]
MDTLRNWESNGFLTVKRKQNGYRVYTDEDLQRLKIIRSLRCANYSLAAILRMLCALSSNPQADIRKIIDTLKKMRTSFPCATSCLLPCNMLKRTHTI